MTISTTENYVGIETTEDYVELTLVELSNGDKYYDVAISKNEFTKIDEFNLSHPDWVKVFNYAPSNGTGNYGQHVINHQINPLRIRTDTIIAYQIAKPE